MSQTQVDATALLCRLLERDKPEINGQALVTDHADAAAHLLRERLLVLGRTLDWVTCPECGIETARVVRELSPDRIALCCVDCDDVEAPRRLRETHKVALQRVIAALLNGLGLSANGLKPKDALKTACGSQAQRFSPSKEFERNPLVYKTFIRYLRDDERYALIIPNGDRTWLR